MREKTSKASQNELLATKLFFYPGGVGRAPPPPLLEVIGTNFSAAGLYRTGGKNSGAFLIVFPTPPMRPQGETVVKPNLY